MIDKSKSVWYGDSSDDIDEYLRDNGFDPYKRRMRGTAELSFSFAENQLKINMTFLAE